MHILIIPGLTMPSVSESLLTRIRETTGAEVRITVMPPRRQTRWRTSR